MFSLASTYLCLHRAKKGASQVAELLRTPLSMQEMQETWVQSLVWEDPLEDEMSTHSSIHSWEIPRTEELAGLQSIGLQRVRQDCSGLGNMYGDLQDLVVTPRKMSFSS